MKSNRSNSSARKANHTKPEQINSEKDFQIQTESPKKILETSDKLSDKSSTKNDLNWKIIIFILLFSTMITVIGMTTVYLIMSHKQQILISQHTQKNHELMNHQNTLISQHTQQNNELMSHIRTLQTQSKECPANTTTFETKWTYFSEPKMIVDFECTSLQQFVFNYKNIIPEDKKITQVKIVIFSRTYQQPNSDFWLRVRSMNGKDEFVHYLFMRTYPKDFVTSQADTIFIPFDKTRQIRVKCSRVKVNWNWIQLNVIGYQQII